MRIVTFNIQHGRLPDGSVDVGVVARTCAGFGADILALQEVDVGAPRSGRRDTVAEVAAATGSGAAFGPATRVGFAGIGRYGNALFVRGSLSEVEVVRLCRKRGSEPRAALVATAELASGGMPVSVLATHLSIDEQEAVDQLGECTGLLAARPSPRVLLGDVNLRTDQVAPLLDAAGYTLVDASVPTFPSEAPRIRIDHVALDGLAARAVEVLPRPPVSDHLPLCVDADEVPAARSAAG